MSLSFDELQKLLKQKEEEKISSVNITIDNLPEIDFYGVPESKVKEYLLQRKLFDEESLMDNSLQRLAHG